MTAGHWRGGPSPPAGSGCQGPQGSVTFLGLRAFGRGLAGSRLREAWDKPSTARALPSTRWVTAGQVPELLLPAVSLRNEGGS